MISAASVTKRRRRTEIRNGRCGRGNRRRCAPDGYAAPECKRTRRSGGAGSVVVRLREQHRGPRLCPSRTASLRPALVTTLAPGGLAVQEQHDTTRRQRNLRVGAPNRLSRRPADRAAPVSRFWVSHYAARSPPPWSLRNQDGAANDSHSSSRPQVGPILQLFLSESRRAQCAVWWRPKRRSRGTRCRGAGERCASPGLQRS